MFSQLKYLDAVRGLLTAGAAFRVKVDADDKLNVAIDLETLSLGNLSVSHMYQDVDGNYLLELEGDSKIGKSPVRTEVTFTNEAFQELLVLFGIELTDESSQDE